MQSPWVGSDSEAERRGMQSPWVGSDSEAERRGMQSPWVGSGSEAEHKEPEKERYPSLMHDNLLRIE